MPESTTPSLASQLEQAIDGLRRAKITNACQGATPAERVFLLKLSELANLSETVSPSDVADAFGVTQAAVTHHLNELEAKQYIVRENATDDRRKVHIRLQEGGQQIVLHQRADMRKLVAYLGEDDTQTMIRLASRITDFLQGLSTQDTRHE